MGQPSFAACAVFWKVPSSMPGTSPSTSSSDDFTSNPPPCFGPNSTVQVTESFRALWPALARPLENAIEKHDACAAASSSSGVVCAWAPSVRAFQLRLADLNAPLDAVVVPLPPIRSPSQVALALLCMMSSLKQAGLL